MKINIRHEKPEDYYTVESITREAFWNLYCPGCSEHYLVHKLRNSPDFIPELSFVIELDGEVVGSIFYTMSKVVSTDGKDWDTIHFGPVSILPSLHRKGLGRAIISHSIEKAKALEYRAIIMGGFPYHYETYGFVGSKKYGICMEDGKYYTGIMALPLYDSALDDVHGTLHLSKDLYPNEIGLDEYDEQFPVKEKLVCPSQSEFQAASSEIDENDYYTCPSQAKL